MITLTEFEDALSPSTVVELTDDANTGSADESVLSAAALVAEEEVRARVGSALRLAGEEPLPALLRETVLALAVERLFARRRELSPAPWPERAAEARRRLDEIAAGRLRPPGSTGSPRVTSTRTPEDRTRVPECY